MICLEMGWTEQEYNSQRWNFIESLISAIKRKYARDKSTNNNIGNR